MSFGDTNNLNILTWNLEWFAKNNQITIDSLVVSITALDADIIAVQEINNVVEFQTLVSQLPDYSGYYSVSNLRLGYIYKSSLNINSISTVFSSNSYNFAGRPPLLLHLNYNNEDFFIFNLHLKCCGDGMLDLNNTADEETRRYNSMNMLKNFIDQNHNNSNVVVLGDFNDVLTDNYSHNVFTQFLNDTNSYFFADIQIANGSSSNWSFPSWPSHIDHILISDELIGALNNGNIETIRVDNYLVGGFNTYDLIISDHLPVGISLSFTNNTSGCTDSTATNYDPTATVDDGSCTYSAANLFFSEYAEGSSNNKYLEIYNASNSTVDLSGYAYPSVSNAPTTVGQYEYWNDFDPGATIAPGAVYIIAHPSADPAIVALANETHYYLSNGDDGYALVHGDQNNYTVIDWLGDWNGDPGSGWSVAGVSNATKDHTLVRKCSVTQGNNDWNASAGTNSSDSEWEVLPQNTWTELGVHVTPCPTVSGCTDSTALNYDPTATVDDGSCIAIVYGCTDATACNYYAGANVDDGSC
ncbi:MAG: hypothetical protein CMD14_02655, partial [Flavobacteriales bacterium]|nr:hypothetical protein [Flavobacteriales bacterium]